ncbi:MAG: hypothetical protein R2784_10930 [Saprospiraceae bacterium]
MANVNHGDLIDFEDTGNIAFRFTKNGALGSMNYTVVTNKTWKVPLRFLPENATIKIGGKYLNTIDYQVTNDLTLPDLPVSGPANNYGYYEGSMSNHDKIIHNVVEALNRREKNHDQCL